MIATADLIRPWALGAIARVVTPSVYHGSHLASWILEAGRAFVSVHGLDPAQFVDGPNAHQEFIYASAPGRGLQEVRGGVAA
jgi:hypothetical protein